MILAMLALIPDCMVFSFAFSFMWCGQLAIQEKNIIDMFHEVTPYYVPKDRSSKEDCIYVSKSMDATTHFESTTLDVIQLYEQITGEAFHLDSKDEEDESKK